jgi:sucrose phosphorylase
MFVPGIPQVWYLDLFAGKNDYEAADQGGTGGHKEINRTTLTICDMEQGLKQAVVQDQLQLMRLRNTSPAFDGELEISNTDAHLLHLTWINHECKATLEADLRNHSFRIAHKDGAGKERIMWYRYECPVPPYFAASASSKDFTSWVAHSTAGHFGATIRVPGRAKQ